MAEEVGEGAGLRNDAAEVVVLVYGDDVAGFVKVLRDVAVAVECGEVELVITRHGKQAADAARTLERAGEIESPEILDFGRVGCATVNRVNCFVNQVPVVIDECSCFDGFPFLRSGRWRGRRLNCRVKPLNSLRRSAAAVVIGVENSDRTVGEG